MKIKNRTDFFTGIGMIVFWAIVSTQLKGLSDAVSAFPRAVFIVGAGLGIALIIKSFIAAPSDEGARKNPFEKVSVIELLLLVYVFGMLALVKTVGLFTCTFLIMVAVSVYLCWCRYGFQAKKIFSAVLYDAVVIGVLYFLFEVILKIRLPDSLLF